MPEGVSSTEWLGLTCGEDEFDTVTCWIAKKDLFSSSGRYKFFVVLKPRLLQHTYVIFPVA